MSALTASNSMGSPFSTLSLCSLQGLLHDGLTPNIVSQPEQTAPAKSDKLEDGELNRSDSELLIHDQDGGLSCNENNSSKDCVEFSQLLQQETNNNSSNDQNYVCPAMPENSCDIGNLKHVELRTEYRSHLRPEQFKCVTLNIRIMRRDADMHVGTLINLYGIKRSSLYQPVILDRWTRTLRVKIKAAIKISLGFRSIAARLGLQNTLGLKYCLDGFYGREEFGDAFGNFGPGICPWMEVTGEASPMSLGLLDGDNIYLSMANEKLTELVRARVYQASEAALKQDKRRSVKIGLPLQSSKTESEAGVRKSNFSEEVPFEL